MDRGRKGGGGTAVGAASSGQTVSAGVGGCWGVGVGGIE